MSDNVRRNVASCVFEHFALLLSVIVVSLSGTGCGANLPQAPTRAEPEAAAASAIETYDKNGDGQLDQQELEACPALVDAGRRVDQNGDGAVTAGEIAGRLAAYQQQSDFVAATTEVTWNRAPLAGAQVVYEPESFMGEGFPTFRGETDADGNVMLISDADGMALLPVGLYRVTVSKKQGDAETLPAKYNQRTTLGLEVADDSPMANRISFHLTD